MSSLSSRILEHASALPEAEPLCPGALLHLGNRAAVDQALSRLARSGQLMRICQGVYMRPVETRFGPCAPSVEKAIASLSSLWGEAIVPCGGAAANALGLTTHARSVARHKATFFPEKDAAGNRIDYEAAVSGGLQLVPFSFAREALADDYRAMLGDGMLPDDSEPFEALIERCAAVEARANELEAGDG